MKPKILSIGEIIWDIYPDRRNLGGAPMNFAAHCALLGADSALLSGVGADLLGQSALKRIAGFGVDCGFVEVTGAPSGVCRVTLDAAGVPSYELATDTAYDAIDISDSRIEEIARARFDAVAFGTIIQRSAHPRERLLTLLDRVGFETVFCDVNLRPNCYDADSARNCLSRANILKVSLEEEPTLRGRGLGLYRVEGDGVLAIARAISAAYPDLREILLTDGAVGAYHYDTATDRLLFEPSVKVEVVSTVGAGDSFGAAYLTARLSGESAERALAAAVRRSAFVVSRAEAVPIE